MRQFTSDELRKAWKQFYIDRGHVDVGAVSLVSDGSTGVMFNVAGMQPLMPYLLGQKHPLGTRLCNVQGCVRTNDIDSVGDKSHVTFFEMMGSWSLGDYFKKERCQWSFELLTQVFGFDADHLAATVFAGDENAPRDEEGAHYRIASGFKKENVYYLPADDNWWGLEYGPCGPDSEMFYIADRPDCGPNCGPGCDCGKYTELGNDVFMQYEKHHDGHLTPLKQKNVDTGWGLERILAFLNGTRDVYQTDLFAPVIAYIEEASGVKYNADEKLTRSMRILADHLRTSVMLIGDEAKLLPSNTGAGYILRRLIRRAVRHGRTLNMTTEQLLHIAAMYIDEIYAESYPLMKKNREFILSELQKEIARFESTLENGMKELQKILEQKRSEGKKEIDGKSAFYLYDTFGFPLELTVELAQEENLTVDEEGFAAAMEEQKQKAREGQNFSQKITTAAGVFDGLDDKITSEFVGYDALTAEGKVVALATETELVNTLKPLVANDDVDVVFCVPAIDIIPVVEATKGTNIQVGAENMYFEEKGAYTGEIAPAMLVDAGVKYVVLGHSERREYFGETNEDVNKKMLKAFEHGITPIMCCGETLTQREQGVTMDFIRQQVKVGFQGVTADQAKTAVIAYEPIWAIGTGKTATTEQAQEVCKGIRECIAEVYDEATAEAIRIQYGGSVNPATAPDLFVQNDIDGGLVGGASLKADFGKIVNYK